MSEVFEETIEVAMPGIHVLRPEKLVGGKYAGAGAFAVVPYESKSLEYFAGSSF